MRKPKFIVIDGLDGSGKATQVKTLKRYYEGEGARVLVLDYPRYSDESSICIQRYLNGEYTNPSPVQASMFYAMDRVDSYLKNLINIWDDYDIILADRYVSSNLIHQGGRVLSKINESEATDYYNQIKVKVLSDFKEWAYNFEYNDLGLPEPDKTIILKIDTETSLKNIETRGNKKDEHENRSHLDWASESMKLYSDLNSDWDIVDCSVGGEMKSRERITEEIINKLN